MRELLRLSGAGALLASALLLSSFLMREARRSLAELKELADLAGRLSERIAAGAAVEELFVGGRYPALERVGLLPLLRAGELPEAAFAKTAAACALSPRAKEIFSDFAAGFGLGFREDEAARAGRAADALRALYERESAALSRTGRLFCVLPLAAALALILLLL